MVRYYFNSNSEIVLTNDLDINIVQHVNPVTQKYFANKDEAIAWATEYIKHFDETLVKSDEKVEQSNEIEDIKGK
ncbi:ABC-type iron transport system FetAB ATPase subunit [Clostridium saccharoperbutylacetonicum]|uniref:Uncharacterized protein n=1 Tax=Clostridium saccharoperbutylacetonicum N1-4(HMT) TaxID=931276 RepID=M1MVS1_9CLOT|nr:hypothetical protein [Clostridium saccharoperbutylacetonicum]AGF55612.1 hypothetical protein Cspa_c18420 [Clostridium saccharoperbutylacetonicum N1-4(HMT)]NRT63667.1 ABC-type iron transport system FetAB ATPase subunit [Clostridium saccharoperbutylacetonicum]NSB27030.1 ABC-type iron transport system FetAB ATPase subunit [Clostridium saccharoperbutylacetonicum]NSB40514.1 ABC-type iron transport system FetAB ATPase subunit [Clostridium saccharoperbutylacetonicum]